jgi:hypothetical protein
MRSIAELKTPIRVNIRHKVKISFLLLLLAVCPAICVSRDLNYFGRGDAVAIAFTPLDPLPSTSSYFIGNNAAAWICGVPDPRRLIRRGIYPGIDLISYRNQGWIEFDFVVSPHSDPRQIRSAWTGIDRRWLESNPTPATVLADNSHPSILQIGTADGAAILSIRNDSDVPATPVIVVNLSTP